MQESISFDKDLRDAVKETVTTLSKAVKSTLGPSGTNVGVLSEISLPVIVNDGVTVAKKFKFEDPLKKYISNILKTVSQNTDNTAGDGTTTSITLAEAIILEGIKHIEADFSQVNIAKGIREATLLVLEQLEDKSISVIDNKARLLQVASISANNDKVLGKIISEAFLQVGIDGQIEVKDSTEDKTYVDFVPGMVYSNGFESSMFTNTTTGEAVFEDCRILIYEGKLRSIDPILELLKDVRNANDSILIIADDYDRICIEDLAANKVQGQLKICAVKSPGYGVSKEKDLEDIAFVTGTQIISKRFGVPLENFTFDMVGKAATVKADKDSFTIIEDSVSAEEIEKRVSTLKAEAKKVSNTEKTELLDRIARLSNGIAVMYVHGNSPVEIAEKKYRIEDAINATRASLEEGIVVGGGIALLRIGKALKTPEMENMDQQIGFNILKKALEAPIKTICENSGINGDVVINEVLRKKSFNYGYDAKLKEYKDLVKGGVVDPLKVTKAALTNASSVSQMILTMNCAIY